MCTGGGEIVIAEVKDISNVQLVLLHPVKYGKFISRLVFERNRTTSVIRNFRYKVYIIIT